MQTLKNQELLAFRNELLDLWNRQRHLGRAEILTKTRASLYNHDRQKAQDIETQTIIGTELLQQNLADDLRLLIDSVGTSAKPLTDLPFIPAYFVGREADFEAVHTQLFAGENLIMLVNGQGGIGKSAFAGKYWERYECNYQFLISLFAGNGIMEALLSLDRKLGIEFEPTMSNKERLAILLDKVKALDKPCLLLLDNVDKAEYLDETYHALQTCKNFHILITSRLNEYKGVEKYKLKTLDSDTALTMFKQFYKKFDTQETDLFYQVFDYVEGNTLVIELFAKNLNEFHQLKKYYSLDALLRDVKKGVTQLEQQAEVETDYHHTGIGKRFGKPEKVILSMYDLSELSEAETALLSVLAVLPAENISFDTLTTLLQDETIDTPLLSLAQKGWIDQNEDAFKISPVVQDIIRHKNQNRLWQDCEKLVSILIDKLQRDKIYLYELNLIIIYIRYAENILFAFKKPYPLLSFLFERVGVFYQITNNLEKSLYYFCLYNSFEKEFYNNDPQNYTCKNSLAISYEKLGEVHSNLGNLNDALNSYSNSYLLMNELVISFPYNDVVLNGFAISSLKLFQINKKLGNYNKSFYFLIKAHQTFLILNNISPENNEYKKNLALSYLDLGDNISSSDEALSYFNTGNLLLIELNNKKPNNIEYARNLALSFERLGRIHFYFEKFVDALLFFKKDMKIHQDLSRKYPQDISLKHNLAISFSRIAMIYSALGKHQKSFIFFKRYYVIEKKLHTEFKDNLEFKFGLAISLANLGICMFQQNKKEKCKSYFFESKKLFEELRKDYPDESEINEKYSQLENYLANFS